MISTKGRYALRLMLDLAQHGNDGFVALKDIAARQEISKKYLEQIIPALSRAGLLITGKGAKGGYALARPADRYTVGDVLRAAEGSLAPVACLDKQPFVCPRVDCCLTLPVWSGLYKVINEYLDSITLQSIIDSNSGDDYVI